MKNPSKNLSRNFRPPWNTKNFPGSRTLAQILKVKPAFSLVKTLTKQAKPKKWTRFWRLKAPKRWFHKQLDVSRNTIWLIPRNIRFLPRLIGTRSGPGWYQIWTSSGPDLEQIGIRSGPAVDQIGIRSGTDWDNIWTRSGSDWDQVWTSSGPDLDQIGTRSGPDLD